MALWQGTSLNTNALAKLFNNVHTSRSIAMVTKATPLFNSMMGRPDDDGRGAYQKRLGGWAKSQIISGDKHEVSLLGALIEPASIADGSTELTTATIAYDNDQHGAAEFILAHYGKVYGMPASEFRRIRGKEAKTKEWAAEFYDMIVDSYAKKLSAELHEDSTSAPPARSQFGSWLTAVDDGNTYGTIDRTDSGNADYRALVLSSAGTLTIAKLQEYINRAKMNRGKVSVGVAGITLFNALQQLVQPYSQATYSRDTASFGSDHVFFGGVDWVLDPDCPSGKMGMFDPSTWKIIANDNPFTETGLVFEPTLNSGWIMNTDIWCQNICLAPNRNVKLEDVTA